MPKVCVDGFDIMRMGFIVDIATMKAGKDDVQIPVIAVRVVLPRYRSVVRDGLYYFC
jgi:hypothetical protein